MGMRVGITLAVMGSAAFGKLLLATMDVEIHSRTMWERFTQIIRNSRFYDLVLVLGGFV